jgi:hypothetical protein
MSINIVHKKLSLLDAPLMPQKPNWISSMWWWHILNMVGWFFLGVCSGESKNINVLPKIENNLDCKIPTVSWKLMKLSDLGWVVFMLVMLWCCTLNIQLSKIFFFNPKNFWSLKSSCLHPVFGPLFTAYPVFERGPQSKEVLLNLGMKCWNSAFNVQGSR